MQPPPYLLADLFPNIEAGGQGCAEIETENPRLLLRRFGIRPKKSLGQNFLVDDGAAERIVAAANLSPDDIALEIGPGLGALTRHLAAMAARVVAVELDQRLMPVLQHTLAARPNVELVHGDILQIDLASLPLNLNYKVVAAGDSYNDTSMLGAAHAGILFRPPQNVIDEFPQFPVTTEYEALEAEVESALARLS